MRDADRTREPGYSGLHPQAELVRGSALGSSAGGSPFPDFGVGVTRRAFDPSSFKPAQSSP